MTYRAETTAHGTSINGLKVEPTITCRHRHLTAAAAAGCARRQAQEMRLIAGRRTGLTYTQATINRRTGNWTAL